MATVNELLTLARKQLGICENPPSSNNVRYNTWYYGREVTGSAYPWCMVFVQWCFAQVGAALPKRTASCGGLMRAAQAAGCWVTRDFQPGDVVIYDFPGGAATDHCGIVEMELPDYGVQAVEGNTSQSGSQSNGGMVCRKSRPKKYIVGAVRPQFDTEKEDDMDISAMISRMTDRQVYELLEKAQRYASTLPEPAWSQAEGHWQRAIDTGVINGGCPEGLLKRDEFVAVLGRKGLV